MGSNIDNTRWMVRWPARTLTQKRELSECFVCEVMKGGMAIQTPNSIAIGSLLNIEFFINFRNKKHRIRAKTKVTNCHILSNNEGVLIDLKITQCSPEEIHTLNNVLMTFQESTEVDLRVTRTITPAKL